MPICLPLLPWSSAYPWICSHPSSQGTSWDDVILGGQTQKLKYFLIGILCVGIGRCIFSYAKEYTFDVVGANIVGDMRQNLFRHIQSLSADFFDRFGTGELMSRIKDDIDRIWDAITFVGMLLLEVIFHTSIVLFCMYSLNWRLAILPTACMAIAAGIAIFMEKKLDEVYEAISEENGCPQYDSRRKPGRGAHGKSFCLGKI